MPAERTGLKAGGLLWVPEGLVLVKRIGSGRDGLVIPKGGPKPGDPNLAATAEREMYEETGYRARVARFLDVVTRGSIDVDSPESYKEIHVFLMGDGVRDDAAVPERGHRIYTGSSDRRFYANDALPRRSAAYTLPSSCCVTTA